MLKAGLSKPSLTSLPAAIALLTSIVIDMPAAPPQPPVGDGAPAGKSRGRELWGVAGKKVRMAVRMSMGFHTLRDMDGEEAVSESSLKRVKALGEGAFAAVDLCWCAPERGAC